jgi:hypothetical protein
MATYAQVAHALVAPGYLSEADIEAAAAVLADALVVSEAEDDEALALADKTIEEEVIAGAVVAPDDDLAAGHFEGAMNEAAIIADAKAEVLQDEAIIAEAETAIAAAYADAAAALVAAELIDEANAEAVTAVIADVWGA